MGTSDLEQPLKIGQDQLLYGFDYTIVSFDTKIMTYSEPGNDLGLIKLLKTVTFTGKSTYKLSFFTNYLLIIKKYTFEDDIRPICLHKEYESELESFTAFTAAGWEFGDLDKPSQLKKRKVWIINTNVCEKLYSDTAVNSNTLCTEDSESSACHLEGGSPLMKVCFKILFIIK